MLNAKFEGTLNPFLTATEVAVAGQVAMLDEDNKVVVSDGTKAHGFFAQDVKDVARHEYRPLVGERAYVGEKVGIYQDGGVYYTDQFVEGTYNPNDKLYVTANGLLTNVYDEENVTATAGNVLVGVVEYMDPARGLRFKALI